MNHSKSKHAVITGAGRGIGAAIATELYQAGYRVSLLGRQQTPLEHQVTQLGDQSQALVCDITDEAQVEQTFATAVANFGQVDVLINNAGAAKSAPFLKTDAQTLQQMLAVNYLGACYCIQQVLPAMLAADAGRIINIGSTSSVKGYAYVSAYAAAKHAIMGLTRSIALEIGESNVTINTVCPGFTRTDIVEDAIRNIMQKTNRDEAQAIADLTKHNPQKRFVEPQEVAAQVLYLADKAPQSVNGQAIMLDGGETA